MSSQLIVASSVEILLMLLSFLLLSAGSVKSFYRWSGAVILSLTFCWSVILGCVLALHEITFRI